MDPHVQRDAVLGMANTYMQMGRYDDSTSMFQQLIKREPTQARYRVLLGLCHGMRNRYEDAIRELTLAVEMDPKLIDARIRLGDIYRSQNQYAEAIECFKVVLAQSAQKGFAALRLAELYLEEGELEKARVNAEIARDFAPESADAFEVHAQVCEKLGSLDTAKDHYRAAWVRNPIKYESMYRLGLLLASSEDEAEQQEGRELVERFRKIEPLWPDLIRVKSEVDLSPRNPLKLWQMAGLLNASSEYDQSRQWAERALSIDQNFAPAMALLGMVHANLGNNSSALRAFETVQGLLQNNPNPEVGPDPEIQGYIDRLRAGEPLPLPLGTTVRRNEQAPAGDGSSK